MLELRLSKVTQDRRITMAKPLMPDLILHGKVAREFERRFLLNTKLDPVKAERNKKDLELYRANKIVR